MDPFVDDYKRTRSYNFAGYHVFIQEYVDNSTGCYHYDVMIGDEEGIGFDSAEQLPESLLHQMARIVDYASTIYRAYGVEATQRDMRKALGIN